MYLVVLESPKSILRFTLFSNAFMTRSSIKSSSVMPVSALLRYVSSLSLSLTNARKSSLRKLEPHSLPSGSTATAFNRRGETFVTLYVIASTVPPPASSNTKVSPIFVLLAFLYYLRSAETISYRYVVFFCENIGCRGFCFRNHEDVFMAIRTGTAQPRILHCL